jgi:hypothetical protein
MELIGRISTWNDNTLTGTLEPIDKSAILQISAAVFSQSNWLPQVDDFVVYQIEVGSDGRKQVVYAEYAGLKVVKTADFLPARSPVQSGRSAWPNLVILVKGLLVFIALIIALIIVLTLLAIPLGMLLAWLFPK